VSFLSKVLGDMRREAELPGPNGLVADLETTLKQKFRDISESELVSQSPENSEKHDVCRKLQIIERSSCSFIELASA
jgi:hypothetical protein